MGNPDLIGETHPITVPVSDPFDQLNKGRVDPETKENRRRVSDQQIAWFEALEAKGMISRPLNTGLITHADSRYPELAGLSGALWGSFYALLVCFLISFPVGIAAAIYLEEFAPRNRFTDIIEVNINNLAAVPSVVFGLLALAVFIGWFGLPRSAPLVGGMALSLMTLPTIIIATRAAIKAVPPSIREAALGVGASKHQVVFSHVLPLAMPGILTGTIIGLAQALGETAPLLIGMNAFITSAPDQHDGTGDGAADADLHLGRQPRAGVHLAHLGGHLRAAHLPDPDERPRRVPAQEARTALVTPEKKGPDMASEPQPQIATHTDAERAAAADVKITTEDVHVFYGETEAIKGVDMEILDNTVTAFIGPSGCGKSTFLRCLNRMNDTIDICRVTGRITLDGENIYDPSIDPVQLRARIGMVFQKPNPFPKSIYDNVAYGPRIHGLATSKAEVDAIVEKSLHRAALWDEVKDRMDEPGTSLSGGQQQRLCIARAIATSPEVLLMDEPASALDPIATAQIEELIDELRKKLRRGDRHPLDAAGRARQPATAYFHLGEVLEYTDTGKMFTNPDNEKAQQYITGGSAEPGSPEAEHAARGGAGGRKQEMNRQHRSPPSRRSSRACGGYPRWAASPRNSSARRSRRSACATAPSRRR